MECIFQKYAPMLFVLKGLVAILQYVLVNSLAALVDFIPWCPMYGTALVFTSALT
jgi:hypothetical protein